MIRRAFTMRLKLDALVEYKYHHDHIWPELVEEIERAGIARITTFQRDLDLFLVSEIEDEAAWDKLWNSEVHRRWAEVMQPLMHLRDDGIVESGELTEVFHLTTAGRRNEQRSSPAGAVTEPTSEGNMQFDAEAIAESSPVEPQPDAPVLIEADILLISEYEPAPSSAAETSEPPSSAAPDEPATLPAPGRKPAPRRVKKSVAKKRPAKKAAKKKLAGKKKSAKKKAKTRSAKKPKARAATKATKKAAKKSAGKKSAKKKAAPKKAKKAVKKKAAKKAAKKKPAKKRRK
jgi:L-rhamnose mutarotase